MKKLLLVLLGLSLPLLGQTSLTPTLTSISPVSGNQGATLTVTLTGSGFTNPSSVLFSGNGVAVQSVRFVSATSLTATMALSAPAGAYTVRIATSGGTSGTQTFTILPSPITSATQLAVTTFAGQGSVGSADGPGAEATFAGPTNIWGDNTSLYISDSFNSVIRRISLSSGTVSTIAGSALRRGITDGTGANARFGVPLGIWGDGTNLYVADAVFDTIRKIVLDSGTVTTIAGSATDPSGSADGPGSTARFNSPGGVWGDGTNLYVADYSNYTIRKIVLATNTVSTIAGIAGSRGTEDGTGSAARFYAPEDLWGDGKNLYVADGSSIRQVNLTNGQVTTLAGNPSLRGYADGKASEARFTSPGGLWGDGTNLYVADSGNHVIRKISIEQGTVTTVAGSPGVAGTDNGTGGAAHFNQPGDVWGDGIVLYISDSLGNKMRKATAISSGEPAPPGLTFSFGDRAGLSRTTTGTSTSVQVGSAVIVPNAGSTSPSGLAIFGYTQEGILVSEAAVAATAPVASGRIFAEINGPVDTGIAIANANSQSVTVNFYFTTDTGANLNSGTTTIPAGGQIAAFLDQPPFLTTGDFQVSRADIRSFTFSSSLPISVVALRGFTNERSEFLITTLPIVPLNATGFSPVIFPHFADGGGWTTQVILVNPSDSPLTGSVEFFTQGTGSSPGTAAAVTVEGLTSGKFPYTIAGRSSVKLVTLGNNPSVQAGWVRVTPSPGVISPSGLSVFSFQSGNVTVAQAGVPASFIGSAQRLYVEASGDFNRGENGSVQTGLAISNSDSSPVSLNFEITSLSGTSTGLSGTTSIPANGQVALFLNQISGLSALPNPFRGILRISGAPVSVVGLRGRYNQRGDFLITTTPPIDEAATRPVSQYVFPHFADGGGYTTQFILFSGTAGQSSSGTITFGAQNGQGLNLAFQ